MHGVSLQNIPYVGESSNKIQGEHKRTLYFQNDTENKCSVLRTSHLHQSIEKLSKFCKHVTETWYVLRESHGRCRDDNPTHPKFCAECSLFLQMHPFCLNFLYQVQMDTWLGGSM
jgi:hypothetical protein